MATRARIGIRNTDGTVTSIYSHWDGYPEHNGTILAEHYTSEEKIRALLALGDLSSLGAEIGEKCNFNNSPKGQCVAYRRDRGEDGVAARTHPIDTWPDNDQEWEYLWVGDRWHARQPSDAFEDLDGVLARV